MSGYAKDRPADCRYCYYWSRNAPHCTYQRLIERNLELDLLKQGHPYDTEMLDEIMSIILDTVCSKRQYIRVAGDDKPKEVVKSVLLKLNSEHIEFVLDCMKENTTRVRNIRQYLLAALYNAPMTISSYYGSLVSHDMATETSC